VPDRSAVVVAADVPGRSRLGLIERRDLVAALEHAADKRVTLISAPAGSGKTSLPRAWAERPVAHRRIAFLSVRPSQRDPQLFWPALLAAVRAAACACDAVEPPAAMPGFNAGAMVEKVPEAVEQLAALLAGLPPDVHVLLATRHDPPLRLHKLRLAGELAEVRAAQLRFTEAETRELLAASGVALPDHVAGMLHRRTEGWAARLRLTVLSLTGHPDPEQFVADFSGSHRTVAEYLIAEMLERQPPHAQRLLLLTSLLDRVNGELADLLTGAAGSERILLELEDANAFVVSLDPGRSWFRYHHMFADLLRLELRRTCPQAVPELHRLAARWFAEHAQAVDTVRHLQAAGDWTEAARLLADHTVSLTLDGAPRPWSRCCTQAVIPVLQATSCAFGPDGRLYITSARHGLSAEELARSPLSGSVFVIDTGAQGVAVRPFRA
jgi:LuxR family transcriptional regulator, maltose regulon positive regulatory protein